jgi:hypothetical protein
VADIAFERILLPIVKQNINKNREAKASEGDRPRMSENTISVTCAKIYEEYGLNVIDLVEALKNQQWLMLFPRLL